MKLYLISQQEKVGYDTYDSAVVAAESESEAVKIHPDYDDDDDGWGDCYQVWASSPDNVECECIGVAEHGTKKGVILASFNAG